MVEGEEAPDEGMTATAELSLASMAAAPVPAPREHGMEGEGEHNTEENGAEPMVHVVRCGVAWCDGNSNGGRRLCWRRPW